MSPEAAQLRFAVEFATFDEALKALWSLEGSNALALGKPGAGA